MARHSMFDRNHPHFSANKALTKMRYADLQAAVIMRGMSFEDVVEGDHGRLANWFVKYYESPLKRERLEQFDDWMENQLEQNGYKKNHPLRKFRRFSMEAEEEGGEAQVKTRALRRADVPKKKKLKRSRDAEFGIFKGTKKEYTYKLTKSLWDAKRAEHPVNTIKELQKRYSSKLLERVQKKFTDAQDKSVKIWMKRCLDELAKTKK